MLLVLSYVILCLSSYQVSLYLFFNMCSVGICLLWRVLGGTSHFVIIYVQFGCFRRDVFVCWVIGVVIISFSVVIY